MRATVALLGVASALAACKRGGESSPAPDAAPPAASLPSAVAVAEPMPRCRADGPSASVPGDDVVLGDAVLLDGGATIAVAVTRRFEGKRLASVARFGADLGAPKVTDVGPALGDAPPPLLRVVNGALLVATYAKASGAPRRELRVARLEGTQLAPVATLEQQADESFALDLAAPDAKDAPPIVAWDEDASLKPGVLLAERGVVKVQALTPGGVARVASPDTSDAEEPRVVARPGGGVLVAWLARRAEALDAGDPGEGPGERRAFRWVEVLVLDAKGEPRGPARAVTSERGRVASFDLVRAGDDVAALVVDEAAHAEGAGARLLRVGLLAERAAVDELLDGGVAHGAADILPAPSGVGSAPAAALASDPASRWLAWVDTSERTWLAPMGRGFAVVAPASLESGLGGARPLVAVPGGLVAATSAAPDRASAPLELRRFRCR